MKVKIDYRERETDITFMTAYASVAEWTFGWRMIIISSRRQSGNQAQTYSGVSKVPCLTLQ